MAKILALSIGSMAGGLSRYFLSAWTHRCTGDSFPYGTLAVNMIGCFLIGFLSSYAKDRWHVHSQEWLFLAVGFLGAFTTFSAFMLETGNLAIDGRTFHAILNVVLSLILGFVLFFLGLFLGKWV